MLIFVNRIFGVFVFIATLLCLSGCKEENTPIYSSFTNAQELIRTHQSGDRVKVEIFARADKGNLSQIKLSTYDAQNGNNLCFDSLVSVKTVNLTYDYIVPTFLKDSVRQELQLEVLNDNGDKSYHTLSFLVCKSGSGLLKEYSGLLLYDGKSGNPNALDLRSPSQTFNMSLADTSIVNIDIYAYAADDTSESLSREWRTKTDVEFVRFNDFDYVHAGALSLETLFNSSRRSNTITNIEQGDIILVGKANQVWGVFLVALCYDQDGVNQDGYLLNYKCIE